MHPRMYCLNAYGQRGINGLVSQVRSGAGPPLQAVEILPPENVDGATWLKADHRPGADDGHAISTLPTQPNRKVIPMAKKSTNVTVVKNSKPSVSITKRSLTAKAKKVSGFLEQAEGIAAKLVDKAAAGGAILEEVAAQLKACPAEHRPMTWKAFVADHVGMSEMQANKWRDVHVMRDAFPQIARALPQQVEVMSTVRKALKKTPSLAAELTELVGDDGTITIGELPDLLPSASPAKANSAGKAAAAEASKADATVSTLTPDVMASDQQLRTVDMFLQTTKDNDPVKHEILRLRRIVQSMGGQWGDEAQMSEFEYKPDPLAHRRANKKAA